MLEQQVSNRRLLIAVTLFILCSAVETRATPLDQDWMAYSMSGVFVGVGAALPSLVVSSDTVACGTCERASIWKPDRWTAGVYREDADALSHATLAFSLSIPLGSWAHAQQTGHASVTPRVVSQSLSTTYLVTQLLKVSFQRARPFTYAVNRDEGFPSITSRDARLSFPSGHTSMAFAALISTAALRSRGASQRVGYTWYGMAAGLGSLTGTLRVLAGKHYWTDVLAGAVIGTGIGLLFPYLSPQENHSGAHQERMLMPLMSLSGTL